MSKTPKPITFKFILIELRDPENMLKWCMNVGLIGDKYVCDKCGECMKLCKRSYLSDKYAWRCRSRKNGESAHEVMRTVRKGTWFENSRMTLNDILLVTHLWCMKASNEFIMREVEVSSTTAVEWKCWCREVCVELCMMENELVGGPGVIVEVDVSKFGKRKFYRRGRVDGKWVYGGIERGTSKCFMCVVSGRGKDELLEVIERNVLAGTTIVSECWRSSLDVHDDEDFRGLAEKRSFTFRSHEGETNGESTWSAVKKSLGTKCSEGDFNSYVFEDMWRKKHAKDPDLTRSFLEAIKKVYPLMTYE